MSKRFAVITVPIVPRDDAIPGPLTLGVEIDPTKHDKTKKQKGEVGITTVGDRTFLAFATEADALAFKGKKP